MRSKRVRRFSARGGRFRAERRPPPRSRALCKFKRERQNRRLAVSGDHVFGFYKYWKYKQKVRAALYALLLLYPKGVKAILRDYPGINSAIRSNFKEETPPDKAAIFIAGFVLADVFDNLD